MDKTVKVFVYGTLMECGGNHSVLTSDGAKYIGDGTTERGAFVMHDLGWYPGVLPATEDQAKGGPVVHGEVYEVSPRGLRSLDTLEGYPRLYRREVVRITLASGQPVNAVIYIYNRESGQMGTACPVIPTGCWRGYKQQVGRGRRARARQGA